MYALIQKHKRLAAIVIAVASLSFLFWMFSVADLKQMFGLKRCVADVEGSCITPREFRYELLKYANLMEKEDLRSLVKRQVLYSLINREAFYIKALRLGIVASDREVYDAIRNDSSFQEGGKFSLRKYRETLERAGFTPAEYETYLKKLLTVRKLINFIKMGTYLTDREIEFQERILATRFFGRAYLISPERIKPSSSPTEKELREFYTKNRDRFRVPEKKVYRLWKTEKKEKAHSLYSQIKKGRVPEGGRKLEGRELDTLPGQVLQALKSLRVDRPYTLTKSGETYYILLLEKVEPERVKSFEEAKEEIERLYFEEEKEKLSFKKAREIKDALAKGRRVDLKPLRFEETSLDEFMKLFRIQGEEVLRLVFSEEKVFGPYKTGGGYVVLYIEKRVLSEEGVKNMTALKESLKKAKLDSLLNLFADSLMKSMDVKVNEDYLK